MQLNLPLQKKAIFLSSMNGIYTVIFYIHLKGFCNSRVSFLLFKIFIEIYSSRFLLMLSYSASVSPYYYYSSLITSTSQFSIYLPRSVFSLFEFLEATVSQCFEKMFFWKLPNKTTMAQSFLKTFSGSSLQFSRKACLQKLFSREHVSVWFCKNELHNSDTSGNFGNSKTL